MSGLIPLFTEVRKEIERTDNHYPPTADNEKITEEVDWICSVEVDGWDIGIDQRQIEQI